MIQIDHLTAGQGEFSLGPIDLDLVEDSYLTILGPSGSGKTLFLETCKGFLKPRSGTIRLDGTDVTNMPPENRQISYLPQDLALFSHFDVRANILFGARQRKLDQAVTKSRLEDLLDLLDQLDLRAIIERQDVNTLSGGEKLQICLRQRSLWTIKMSDN